LAKSPPSIPPAGGEVSQFSPQRGELEGGSHVKPGIAAEFETTLSLPQATSPEIDEDEGFNNQVSGLVTGLQAQIAVIKGDLPRAIALSQQALAYLGEDGGGPRGVILHNLALAYGISGEAEKARGLLAKLGAAAPDNNDPAALMALNAMAELKRMQGQNRQAFSLYQQFLQQTAEKEGMALSPIAGLAHTEVGHLLYEWNDLAGAEAHLRQGIKLGNQGAGFRPLMLGYIGLFWVRLAQENFDEAAAIIQQVEQLTAKMGADHLAEMTTHMWADLWLARRDFEALAQWIQASRLTVEDEFDNRSVFTYTVFAQVLLAQGELSAATSLLARLLVFWKSVKQTHKVIEILALQALTFQAQQNLDQALATLQHALILAEPEGYIRTFVDKGAPMAALLEKMKAREAGGRLKEYIHQLLAAFPKDEIFHPSYPKGTMSLSPQPLVEPLTKRELEVLQLLTTDLSRQEIADKLVISQSTLKTHLRRVYDKLGVKSRAQAVVKSKGLHLI
jgi:LuxR family maltose regulon positive regulatory protein